MLLLEAVSMESIDSKIDVLNISLASISLSHLRSPFEHVSVELGGTVTPAPAGYQGLSFSRYLK